MKLCTKCNTEKELEDFVKSKEGRKSICKSCHTEGVRIYYQLNREKINAKKRQAPPERKKELADKKRIAYTEDPAVRAANKERCKSYQRRKETLTPGLSAKECKAYYQANKEKILAEKRKSYQENEKMKALVNQRNREYYAKNRQTLLFQKHMLYQTNKKRRLEKDKVYRNTAVPSFSHYKNLLTPEDTPQTAEGSDNLTVVCKLCKRRFTPTITQVKNRVHAVKNTIGREGSFYCSNECKNSCPVFGFKVGQNKDHRSKSEELNPRQCQTNHLKQLQCDNKNSTYCEKCGDYVIDIYLHHTHTVAKNPSEAVNSAGHMILCYQCHKEIHQQC